MSVGTEENSGSLSLIYAEVAKIHCLFYIKRPVLGISFEICH